MEPRPALKIIAAVLGGQPEAYVDLVDRYRNRSNRFAVRFLRDRDDADEAAAAAMEPSTVLNTAPRNNMSQPPL